MLRSSMQQYPSSDKKELNQQVSGASIRCGLWPPHPHVSTDLGRYTQQISTILPLDLRSVASMPQEAAQKEVDTTPAHR